MVYLQSIRFYFFHLLFVVFFPLTTLAQGDCEATTLDQFFECYGGKKVFNNHAVKALTTFVEVEEAIEAGNFVQAKAMMDDIYKTYPIGDNIWWNVWEAPNGANVGSPHCYYGLRMMEDIVAYGLKPNPQAKVKKVNMNIVLVGCSKGILPTTKEELANGTGQFVTHTLNSKLKENNYRIIRQSLNLFVKYIKAITNGALDVHLGFIELDTLCLPVSVSKEKPYVASGDYGAVLNALTQQAKDTTDWFMINYPSHVPDFPVFDDESFITGGMGADNKGGPVFIADDKWVVRKPAHLGKGNYTDIERRTYLPQWLQHEFFHHLYRIYPELKLEVNGHDWFDRKFWASDFTGQFETDYYSETLHKRLLLDCEPLAKKLITRIDTSNAPAYSALSIDELLGPYSLENVQNAWHEGSIIKQENKYFWKNKANVQWEVIPRFDEGKLKTGNDSPYKGQDFFLQLYQNIEGDVYPSVISLKFNGEFYKKRFDFMRQTFPIELALGNYTRVPANNAQHKGNVIKSQGKILWQNDAGDSWSLIPNTASESFSLTSSSPTPNEKFRLILVNTDCDVHTLGFKYLNYYYWKPKRSAYNESPKVIKAIDNLKLETDFEKYSLTLSTIFADTQGDSLLFFATSNDTSLINTSIQNGKLILTGGKDGNTTIYVMALDNNGGLAADEFDVSVKTEVSTIGNVADTQRISVSPTVADDFIFVTGLSPDYTVELVSAITGHKEVPISSDNAQMIDIHLVPSGTYFLIFTNNITGEVQRSKIIVY
jgi:hypothetical protein